MRFIGGTIAAVSLLAAAWAASAAHAQEIKSGKWEYTAQTNLPGAATAPKLTPEQLAKLPADVRERFEQITKGGGVTYSKCITPDKAVPVPDERSTRNCTVEKMERNGGTLNWAATCAAPDGRVNKNEAIIVYTGDTMTMDAVIHTTRPNGAESVIKQHITGRYLGPCGG